jgi:hypothetical protein
MPFFIKVNYFIMRIKLFQRCVFFLFLTIGMALPGYSIPDNNDPNLSLKSLEHSVLSGKVYPAIFSSPDDELYLPLASYTFTNAGGNNLWSNANNWSPNGIPQNSADNVSIGIWADTLMFVIADMAVSINTLTLGAKATIKGDSALTIGTFNYNDGTSLEGTGSINATTLNIKGALGQHKIGKELYAVNVLWTAGDIIIQPLGKLEVSNNFLINFGSIGSPTYKFQHLDGLSTNIGNFNKICAIGTANFESPINPITITVNNGFLNFNTAVKISKTLAVNNLNTLVSFKNGSNQLKGLQGNGVIIVEKAGLILDSLNGYRFFNGTMTIADSAKLTIPNTIHTSIYPLNFDLNIQGSILEYNGTNPMDIKNLNIIPLTGTNVFKRSKTQGIGKIMPRVQLTLKNAEIHSKIETGLNCNTIFNSATISGLGKTEINDSLVINDTLVWQGTNDSIILLTNGKLVDNSSFLNWRADTVNLINNGGTYTFNNVVKNVYKLQATTTRIKTQYNLPPVNFTKGYYTLSAFPELTNSITISSGTGGNLKLDKPNFEVDAPFTMYNNSILNIEQSGSFKNDFQSTDGLGNSTGKINIQKFSGAARLVSFAKNPSFGDINLLSSTIKIDTGFANVINYTSSSSKVTSASGMAMLNITGTANSTNDTFDIKTAINGREWKLTGTVIVTNQTNLTTNYIDIIPSAGTVTLRGGNVLLNGYIHLDKSPYSYLHLPDIDSLPADIYGSKKSSWRPTLYLAKNASKKLTGHIYGEVDIFPTSNNNITVKHLDPRRDGHVFGKIFINGNVAFAEDATLELNLKNASEKDTVTIDGGIIRGQAFLTIDESTPPGTYTLITSANNDMTVDPNFNIIFDYFTSPFYEVPPNVYVRVMPKSLDIEVHPNDYHFVENLTGNWSDPSTWHGNVIPDETKQVFIPEGATIYVDTIDAIAKKVYLHPTANLIINENMKLTVIN